MLLILAMALDAVMGEPRFLWSRLPHPVALIGLAIGWADRRFNRGSLRRAKGVAVTAVLIATAIGTGWVLSCLGPVIELFLVVMLLAQKSLCQHVQAVADALRMDIVSGRNAVALIVGRDTAMMDQSAVARSTIESAAENLSDGVIAPAFWFLVGGLPGILAYKVINTADSMIGYKTPQHEAFGWAAAQIDDVVNWIPARLTAVLILLTHFRGLNALRDLKPDAHRHRSPNAGWPEAAMARILGIALSGPRSYDGQLKDFPFANEGGRKILTPRDIETAVRGLWFTWVGFIFLVGLISILFPLPFIGYSVCT